MTREQHKAGLGTHHRPVPRGESGLAGLNASQLPCADTSHAAGLAVSCDRKNPLEVFSAVKPWDAAGHLKPRPQSTHVQTTYLVQAEPGLSSPLRKDS